MFGHKPQQRFINYVDVRSEIENDTKAVVRDDMGVSNIPINLTIYSPHGKSHLAWLSDLEIVSRTKKFSDE